MGLLAGAVKKFFTNIPGNLVTLYFVGGSAVGLGRVFWSLVFTVQSVPDSIGLFLVLVGQTVFSTLVPIQTLVFTSVKAFLFSVAVIGAWSVVKIAVGSLIWTKRWYVGMLEVHG